MSVFLKSFHRFAASVIVATAAMCSASAQDLSSRLPQDPNLIKGTLPNGLTYYIRSNHKPENKVELRLVVKAGSILEDNDQQGLAHFMEHMNFNGTKNFQKNDLVSYLQSIGVQFGADLNAYTSFDETVFMLPIPTDKPGNLEKGFQIIEDWAHNALLTGKDIDDERNVVLEESRLGKGAQMRMLDKYFPELASGSKYAERLPIGKDSILKTFKYETIRKFYHDWYRPDLQAVIIVGDIDTATAKQMLMKHFAGLQNPNNEKKRYYTDVKPRTQPDAMIVTDKEATNSILRIMYPYQEKHDEVTLNDYRDDIKRNLALAMLNRRLNDLAQGDNPPFPFAQVGFDDMIHGYEDFNAITVFGDGGPEKAINALTGELLRAKEYGFTQSELELAKKDMQSAMEKAYNERNTTESKDYVDEYIRNFTDNEPVPGLTNEYDYYKTILPGIQLNEVNGLVQKWIASPNTFTLITAPDKPDVKLPNKTELLAMTQHGLQQQIKQETEKAVATTLMQQLPTPGTVVKQEQEQDLGATTYTLSNGVKVTIKPTDFKSDEIVLKGIKDGGSNSYGVADRDNVHFATDVVSAMGVGEFSPNELEKVMAGKTANVDVEIGEIDDEVSGSSSVKDFESMLQLMYLNLTAPRKDTSLFEAYKNKQKMMLQFMTANPQIAFVDTTIKSLYNNNPLAKMVFPKPENYDKINLDRTLAIYKNEFGDADGYHFFIVGNVKPEEALPLIERYIGSLPTENKTVSYKDNGVRPISGEHTLKYYKGKEKKSLIVASYYGEAPYSEDFSLKAQAVAEILNIKVIQDLREKLGGIYTGGFYANVSKEPYAHFGIGLQLPCGPENVDKLLAAANEEVKELQANGPDPKDLDKVKSQWKEKYLTQVKENKYWTGKLENILFWGRDKEHVLHYEDWINKLTPADIQETAKTLFGTKNHFISILYPEA